MTDESHAGPVFVMGSMGSGTTITRLMLDTHPNLMIARETGFMRALMANYHIPFWQFGDVWLDRIDMTEAELDEAVRRFYDDVFGKAAAKQGAGRWGDKTPFHVHHMRRAGRIFPDAQFVATVRHPGAVANSMKRFGWSWKAGIRTWLNSNQAMIDSGIELGDRMYLIRYEDLVSDTEAVMREVLDFLGEPWDDRVLSHHEEKSGRAEGGTKADEPVDTARIARWTESVSNEQMRRLVSRTQGLAPAFGYDPADPMPVAALNDRSDSIGMTGTEFARKYEELAPPRVEYRAVFENRLYTQLSMAEELEQANLAGRDLRPIRPPYQGMVEQPETPSRTMPARIRRRVSRIINPDS
jgi:protein-tyrosine sulfotransferase